jgi:dihydropteroate synthase
MAVVNCTPDSFSDGGRYLDPEDATHHAQEMLADGADLIDIGGESTRPGAGPVAADQECQRVLPVIRRLRERQPQALISIDTTKPEVAAAALTAGADIINDVTGGRQPAMLELAAAHDAPIILMHLRGSPRNMQEDTVYDHVTAEVHAFLRQQAAAAMAAGLDRGKVWLDPGIGFGKDDTGNLALLAALPDLASLGHPVVVGASRKSFIGRLTGAEVDNRLPGALAALIPAIGLPRAIVRVHEPSPVIQFLEIARRLREVTA